VRSSHSSTTAGHPISTDLSRLTWSGGPWPTLWVLTTVASLLAGSALSCAANGPGAEGSGGSPGTGGQGGTGTSGTGGAGGAGANSGTGGATSVPGIPGVQVKNGAGPLACVPLCMTMTDPAKNPPQNGDYGYESGRSCVIPHTATAMNDSCTTGAPIPTPVPRSGFVISSSTGTLECDPKCVFYLTPTQAGANADGFADDWAYENNATCVIPSTVTANTSLTCTTGMPIPAAPSKPGVTVMNPTTKGLECVQTCTYFKTTTQVGANGDNLGDDWAFEFGASCIIPGTITAFNDPCMTGQALPPPVPRPGIVVNTDPIVDSCKTSGCVPLCLHVTVASDRAFPDWGWENNNSCVIAGSRTATTLPAGMPDLNPGAPPLLPPGPTRKCTWGVASPDFLKPPALNAVLLGARPARFQTAGKVLNDPYGRPFLIRGVNNSDGWFDTCGQYSAYQALNMIAAQGVNTVRLGWAFQSIDPVGPLEGEPMKAVIGTNANLLAEILYHIVELKMVAILALNDSTGQTTVDWPMRMAAFLEAPAYKAVLKAYEPYLLLGIANEWNGDALLPTPATSDFTRGYTMAIQSLRAAQINNALVVTANSWGQGCDSVLQNAATLTAADPLHDVLYDLHLYTYPTVGGVTPATQTPAAIAPLLTACLNNASAANIPIVVGEFGNTHGTPPVVVPFDTTIVPRALANGQGLIPWLWYGDTEFPALDLASSWTGPLSSWGTTVIPMLVATSVKATIFP
jgi:Cellulase (glycosyl hydrolase family 5)